MTVIPPARTKNEPRLEDDALIRGTGHFVDDPRLPSQAYAAFVRSPHAHARVVAVNADEALAAKGVLSVLTGEDIKAAGIGGISRHPPTVGRGGAKMVIPFRPALAGEKVMHVGDPVAMVVAETAAQALDAADLVQVDYEELPAVISLDAAIKAETQLYADAPGNVIVDWPGWSENPENERAVDDIIKNAPHVARVSVTHQRLIVASMETRGATGDYDAQNESYTLHACSQSADALRGQAASIMGVPNEKLRVITEDVGGAFGMKTTVYPEYIATLVAAKKLGRPVHWQSSRSEAFVSDAQARDAVTHIELAFDDGGKFLGLRVRHLCNQGAYIANAGVNINTNNFARCLPGMYRIPKVDVGVACYASNKVPIAPYRGAGRPEANYALERAVEEAARMLKMDPVRLRKKNLIPKSAMPFKTPINTYDSGDFPGIVDEALKLADYAGFNKRKREAAKRKKYRGIGISCMLEHAGATPMEMASVTFPEGDKLILGLNVQSTGQSHATVFGRLLAGKLGIDPARIEHRHGDTALGLTGGASVGSRSAMCAGTAIVHVADVMLEKGKKVAASLLEAGEQDIEYKDGAFGVVGTDRRITLFETARRAKEIGESLDTKDKAEAPLTFPNGCHIAEVEIDPETGALDLVTYTAVDDCGNPLDRTIVEGQVHGSLAQGLGQALTEDAVYDAESGQLVTGSFMDYGMPHAEIMPIELREALRPTPATTNPLGVKGTGEAGTTAAIAAVMNAVANAIPNGAADHMDMPATPSRVWEACQKAQAAGK
ncbi:MAG TPA: xanthine dehydrogenase family protein molybdopterin-binding subunit [Pseudolabrys sp.]|nr:xanthine dehydrogenase family protein molybdopterin-binding subunit [Pseudolabrys sp.]